MHPIYRQWPKDPYHPNGNFNEPPFTTTKNKIRRNHRKVQPFSSFDSWAFLKENKKKQNFIYLLIILNRKRNIYHFLCVHFSFKSNHRTIHILKDLQKKNPRFLELNVCSIWNTESPLEKLLFWHCSAQTMNETKKTLTKINVNRFEIRSYVQPYID